MRIVKDKLHLNYRRRRRSKDWVRSWFYSSDKTLPYLQFTRLNPEE